jgi:hypothetical protein
VRGVSDNAAFVEVMALVAAADWVASVWPKELARPARESAPATIRILKRFADAGIFMETF